MSDWKLVPVEPTDNQLRKMVQARHGPATYKCVSDDGLRDMESDQREAYYAALAAAPPAAYVPACELRGLVEKWLLESASDTNPEYECGIGACAIDLQALLNRHCKPEAGEK